MPAIDLEGRTCRNGRGKLIALIGEPLPPGPLPAEIQETLRQAEAAWRVQSGTTWARAEWASLAASGEGGQAS